MRRREGRCGWTVRHGFLYVPESDSPATPIPLLVALHGATGSADDWRGFYEACESRGLLRFAVDSRGTTWDRVRGTFGPDVAFIDQALAWTFDRCTVDPTRVTLIGFSHGTSDGLLLASRTREVIVPDLQADGYDVTYVELAGGHEVPGEIGSEAIDWFTGV